MKGYFSINWDYCTDELQFCNLDVERNGLGHMSDVLRSPSRIGSLIAHDVVEHSLSHRTKTYVTYEDEMKAVGAVQFVRMGEFDMYQELLTQCVYANDSNRQLKPVPYTIGQHLINNNCISADTIRELISDGISPDVARKAVFHCEWGHLMKEWQFRGHHGAAHSAFHFIEYNAPEALKALSYEEAGATGVSIYFDTEMQTFRYQMKRQY
tara:strand:- start:21226 stop:21855 length:630 start_codon:yes stop_codon:yes gene_type:complete